MTRRLHHEGFAGVSCFQSAALSALAYCECNNGEKKERKLHNVSWMSKLPAAITVFFFSFNQKILYFSLHIFKAIVDSLNHSNSDFFIRCSPA